MKFIKTVIITLLVMAILFTGIFMAGRYGWKVFGFRACEEAAITSVDVSESAVTIKGFYPGSFPEGFCGCYRGTGRQAVCRLPFQRGIRHF